MILHIQSTSVGLTDPALEERHIWMSARLFAALSSVSPRHASETISGFASTGNLRTGVKRRYVEDNWF
eukprot:6211819-Pleurochrysis_carterae.AAC.11